jgi:hypothetical protein
VNEDIENQELLAKNRETIVKAIKKRLRKELPGHKISTDKPSRGEMSINIEVLDKETQRLRKDAGMDNVLYSPSISITVMWPSGRWRDKASSFEARREARPSFVKLNGGLGSGLDSKYKVKSDLSFNEKMFDRVRDFVEDKKAQSRALVDQHRKESKVFETVQRELRLFATKPEGDGRRWTYRGSRFSVEPRASGMVEIRAWTGGSVRYYVWPDEMRKCLDLIISFDEAIDKLGEPREEEEK